MSSISGTTAAIIAAATTVASATVSGVAMYQSGQSQKKAAAYNAEMQNRQAQDALQRGAIEAAEKRDRARQVASAQREAAAMSGVEVDSGTPLDLLTETAGLGELDSLRTLNNARREAWGHKAQSELDIFQGRAAARGGTLNAAGTFLSGASNAYFGYKSATAKSATAESATAQ